MDIEKLKAACKIAATWTIEAEYEARATDPVFAQWANFAPGDHDDVYVHLDCREIDDEDAAEQWISKNYPEIFNEVLDDLEGNVYYDFKPSRDIARLVHAGVL
jgi:hypothetical protein